MAAQGPARRGEPDLVAVGQLGVVPAALDAQADRVPGFETWFRPAGRRRRGHQPPGSYDGGRSATLTASGDRAVRRDDQDLLAAQPGRDGAWWRGHVRRAGQPGRVPPAPGRGEQREPLPDRADQHEQEEQPDEGLEDHAEDRTPPPFALDHAAVSGQHENPHRGPEGELVHLVVAHGELADVAPHGRGPDHVDVGQGTRAAGLARRRGPGHGRVDRRGVAEGQRPLGADVPGQGDRRQADDDEDHHRQGQDPALEAVQAPAVSCAVRTTPGGGAGGRLEKGVPVTRSLPACGESAGAGTLRQRRYDDLG